MQRIAGIATLLLLAALPAAEAAQAATIQRQEPNGPGRVETTKQAACDECGKKAPYLDKTDPCVCFASDIHGTSADDSTKELTTRKEYGSETVNTGVKRLPEGWVWHCGPVSKSGAWEQC